MTPRSGFRISGEWAPSSEKIIFESSWDSVQPADSRQIRTFDSEWLLLVVAKDEIVRGSLLHFTSDRPPRVSIRGRNIQFIKIKV